MPRVEYDAMKEALDHASAMADYRSGFRTPGLTPDEMREMLAAPSALAFWRQPPRQNSSQNWRPKSVSPRIICPTLRMESAKAASVYG